MAITEEDKIPAVQEAERILHEHWESNMLEVELNKRGHQKYSSTPQTCRQIITNAVMYTGLGISMSIGIDMFLSHLNNCGLLDTLPVSCGFAVGGIVAIEGIINLVNPVNLWNEVFKRSAM